jgi:acyl-CoA synthetase (AMP-forming)/AMP-acid ligase II
MLERDQTAADIFAAVVDRIPGEVAVRHRDRHLTYAELAAKAGGVADWLREHRIGPGDVVATVARRGLVPVFAMLGAWAAGAAYLNAPR